MKNDVIAMILRYSMSNPELVKFHRLRNISEKESLKQKIYNILVIILRLFMFLYEPLKSYVVVME